MCVCQWSSLTTLGSRTQMLINSCKIQSQGYYLKGGRKDACMCFKWRRQDAFWQNCFPLGLNFSTLRKCTRQTGSVKEHTWLLTVFERLSSILSILGTKNLPDRKARNLLQWKWSACSNLLKRYYFSTKTQLNYKVNAYKITGQQLCYINGSLQSTVIASLAAKVHCFQC